MNEPSTAWLPVPLKTRWVDEPLLTVGGFAMALVGKYYAAAEF